jgi:hypothetical protein
MLPSQQYVAAAAANQGSFMHSQRQQRGFKEALNSLQNNELMNDLQHH